MQSEQRNFILAMLLSALVLFGWSFAVERWFPTANPPATKIEAGKTVAVPAPGTPPPTVRAVRRLDRAAVLSATPRVRFQNARVAGSINLTGAKIDDLVLSTYRESVAKNAPPIRLLSPENTSGAYFASFGWLSDTLSVPGPTTLWSADRTTLAPGAPVTLTAANGQGQTFQIRIGIDDAYMFSVEQRVTNAGAAPFAARTYALVNRAEKSHDPDVWVAHVGPLGVLNGAANYDISYDNLTGTEPSFFGRLFGTKAVAGVNSATSNGGWLGFGDKYWLAALAPAGTAPITASFRGGPNMYQADVSRAPVTIGPGQSIATTTHFFAGAKEVNALDAYEAQLSIPMFGKAIDWGWFEIAEKPIFHYLHWLSRMIGNFGIAIMVLTLTVRGIMFPIAQRGFASMAAMRIVQPKMKAIQERYKDDPTRQQREIMALYKTEKINPLAGCLPMLLQVPVFFALYKVLVLTIEMRHQPFFGWIRDLSAPDPLTPVNLFGLLAFTPPAMIAIGVLPILLGVTMYLQFKLNPQPTDPVQAQMFSIMPWVMMFVMAPFAAGLQLYWATSNILTILQQKWLYSKHPEMKTAVAAPAK